MTRRTSRKRSSKRLRLNAWHAKILGYKAMRFEGGFAISGADSRQSFLVRKGHVIRMPGKGIFLSTNREYILKYYAGGNNRDVVLTLAFNPEDIVSGRDTLHDREPELAVSEAKIVDFEIVDNDQ